MTNPWVNLPAEPPFIALCDRLTFESHSYDTSQLRFDAFPDPFVGDLDRAEVIFLALNPGFEPEDISVNLQNNYFLREARLNLQHRSTIPLFYLADELSETFGYKWWRKLLNPIITDARIPLEVIRERMMIVEYMPYHSHSYKHTKQILPSQQYSFELVREAIRRGKPIVIMRSKQFWYDVLPELKTYAHAVLLSNVQTPWISRKNMAPLNPPGTYEKIAAALGAS